MSEFFKCDCVRLWVDHIKWCNRTVHEEFMDESEHDGCDGTHHGEDVHCTDFQVDEGDIIKCTMCSEQWVHGDED